jgi:uncharacterized membrane protein
LIIAYVDIKHIHLITKVLHQNSIFWVEYRAYVASNIGADGANSQVPLVKLCIIIGWGVILPLPSAL